MNVYSEINKLHEHAQHLWEYRDETKQQCR